MKIHLKDKVLECSVKEYKELYPKDIIIREPREGSIGGIIKLGVGDNGKRTR